MISNGESAEVSGYLKLKSRIKRFMIVVVALSIVSTVILTIMHTRGLPDVTYLVSGFSISAFIILTSVVIRRVESAAKANLIGAGRAYTNKQIVTEHED